jgi:hypothetical protein
MIATDGRCLLNGMFMYEEIPVMGQFHRRTDSLIRAYHSDESSILGQLKVYWLISCSRNSRQAN